jgi:peptide/nickel transport system permease protein
MGQLFYMAVMSRDYPTVMGILFIGAVLTLLGNLLADISYALVDPRIRVS